MQQVSATRPSDLDMGAIAGLYTNPDTTEYVCYVDGGCLNNGRQNARAYGSFKVFKNDKDLIAEDLYFNLSVASSPKNPGRATNNMAEALAINRVLLWLKTEGILNNPGNVAFIRSDSELIIKQIKGIYSTKQQQLLNIARERSHILNRIRKSSGRNPWECILFSKIARQRIVDVLGH